MIISERIFKIMKEKEMSQKEFADKTGISQSTISDWKRKKTNPAADKIIVICETFDMSADELLTGTKNYSRPLNDYEMISTKSEEYEMIKIFRNLDENAKNKILGYLDALKDM
ncbi:MAG: helix-turn-helix domain-containing protein [Lachnospiraceae bacterium]